MFGITTNNNYFNCVLRFKCIAYDVCTNKGNYLGNLYLFKISVENGFLFFSMN